MTKDEGGRDAAGNVAISDVFSKAADLIEPQGAWTNGADALDADGRTRHHYEEAKCARWPMVQAISVAAGRYPGHYSVEGAGLCREALRFFERKFGHPYNFNIAPGRTQAECVAKLREAAALAKATAESEAQP